MPTLQPCKNSGEGKRQRRSIWEANHQPDLGGPSRLNQRVDERPGLGN